MINANRGAHRRRWTPGDIDTSLWIDVKDYSTLTFNGNYISGIHDKSGNSYDLSQAAAAYQPLYSSTGINGLPALSFDGVNDRLVNSSFFLSSRFSKYIVYNNKATEGVLSSLIISESLSSGSKIVNELLLSNNYSGYKDISVTAMEKTPCFGCDIEGVHGENNIINYSWNGIDKNDVGNYSIYHNGDNINLSGSGNVGYLANEGGLSIGMRNLQKFLPFYGLISEILIIDYSESVDDVAKVFGYLAHKFFNDVGVSNPLPSNHKYKNIPPML